MFHCNFGDNLPTILQESFAKGFRVGVNVDCEHDEGRMMERSFGVIPLERREGVPWVFVVQNYSGAWLLPKGHAHEGETPLETAARELHEETGLRVVKWLPYGPYGEEYRYRRSGRLVRKRVDYFPSLVEGSVVIERDELADGRWIPLEQLEQILTFPELRYMCRQLMQHAPFEDLPFRG